MITQEKGGLFLMQTFKVLEMIEPHRKPPDSFPLNWSLV